jgi:hypothetical protein
VTTFDNWCALNDVQPLPAAPADIARFVTDCATLGIEKVWPMVQEISRAHYTVGLADPTLGGWVAQAINQVSNINAPRSWPKDRKERFLALPYDVQMYVAAHDMQREKELRRAQNEAAEARQKLGKTNGITSHNAA